MAFNSNIKGYMTFGKSFSRGSAFPLEAYEIWTDYDALVAYAANTDPNKDPSYIGQKVAYVDLTNNKVTHYGIEIDGTLKELGSAPIGDEKSIVVGDNNTISLKGVDALVFERDILNEDGEPTGEKEEVQFQPLMTKEGLVWVEPSKTTVEGLATLINALAARVKTLEDNSATKQELADAVNGLEKQIEAIDFVDDEELAEALTPYAKEADLTELKNTVDAFLTGDGTEAALDSLKELIAYIDSHDDVDISGILEDIQGIENKLTGIDGTVADYVSDAIDALSIGDYAKASELTELAGRVLALENKPFDSYATKNELAEHEQAADNKYATKEELAPVVQTANNASTAVSNLESRFNEIVEAGGEPNAINTIKVNGVVQAITDKVVDIAVPTTIVGMGGYSDIDNRIIANANSIITLGEEDERLAGLIGNNSTNIAALLAKVDTGDKTVTNYIDEQIAAIKAYDDTAIRKLISDEAARADAEEKRIVALIEAEAATARAAEKANAEAIAKNTDDIAALDATLKAALENDGEGLDSIKELAVWIEEHGKTAANMAEAISTNTSNIAAIAGKVDTGDKKVSEYVAEQITANTYTLPIATYTVLGGIKSAALVEEKPVANKVYVDETTGVAEVKTFSTDNLVQGTMTLVLNAGDVDIL